jgi:hypothetical protein
MVFHFVTAITQWYALLLRIGLVYDCVDILANKQGICAFHLLLEGFSYSGFFRSDLWVLVIQMPNKFGIILRDFELLV